MFLLYLLVSYYFSYWKINVFLPGIWSCDFLGKEEWWKKKRGFTWVNGASPPPIAYTTIPLWLCCYWGINQELYTMQVRNFWLLFGNCSNLFIKVYTRQWWKIICGHWLIPSDSIFIVPLSKGCMYVCTECHG